MRGALFSTRLMFAIFEASIYLAIVSGVLFTHRRASNLFPFLFANETTTRRLGKNSTRRGSTASRLDFLQASNVCFNLEQQSSIFDPMTMYHSTRVPLFSRNSLTSL